MDGGRAPGSPEVPPLNAPSNGGALGPTSPAPLTPQPRGMDGSPGGQRTRAVGRLPSPRISPGGAGAGANSPGTLPLSPRVNATPSPGNRAGAAGTPRNRRKCPACKGRIRAQRLPLCCATCGTEYHKKCSGLTRHALRRWEQTRQWECTQCTAHRQQGAAANQPGAPIGAGRGAGADGDGNLLLLQWNVDGITTSLMDLQDLIRKGPAVGVVLVQESKLLPSDPDQLVPGFSTVRLDRPPTLGGTRGWGDLLTCVRQDTLFRQVVRSAGTPTGKGWRP